MIRIPDRHDPDALSDWLETSLVSGISGKSRISDSAILSELTGQDIGDPEEMLDSLRVRVADRERVLEARYPIARLGLGYAAEGGWEACLIYIFLLFASLNQCYRDLSYKAGKASKPAELFERLTEYALKRYVGGDAIRIGAPRRKPVPSMFPEAVRYVSESVNEEYGYGNLEFQKSGDDGVDVIGWRPFRDRRSSQLIILAQCAIGTDWSSKRSGLDLAVWRRHIRWDSEPVKAFAVPFAVRVGGEWRETAARGGIVLDRLRLASLLDTDDLDPNLKWRMENWCKARVKEIRSLEIAS